MEEQRAGNNERGVTSGEPQAKIAEIAKKSFGKPGLAWRLLYDEAFQEQIELAGKLLKTSAASRRIL